MIDPAISMSYDPAGPRNGKWYYRRPDYGWNSYETLNELAGRAGQQIIWRRYDYLHTLDVSTAAETAEYEELRDWLINAGVLSVSDAF